MSRRIPCHFTSSLFLLGVAIVMLVDKTEGTIGADPESLRRIIGALCAGGHDEQLAKQFYNCYFQLPMDEKCLFDKCQKSTWGYLLNTLTNIETTCKTLGKTQTYTGCLMREFQACQKDVLKAVTTINVCQGKLFGLE